jgi:hypothetical protein
MKVQGLGAQEGNTLHIAIENDPEGRKPYLGAYRHKVQGTVFHHAATQTPKAPPKPPPPKANRQVQTVTTRTRSTQAVREHSTQMERRGLVLDTSHDREVCPGKYFAAHEFETCDPAWILCCMLVHDTSNLSGQALVSCGMPYHLRSLLSSKGYKG